MSRIKAMHRWGKHEYGTFILCGARCAQKSDYSITMDQREYVEGLSPHDLQPYAELGAMKDHATVTNAKWIKRFRGANGALQWLCANTQPDLASDTSISVGTSPATQTPLVPEDPRICDPSV